MSFCGNCGTTIPEGSPFCPTCGAPAPAGQQAPQGGGSKFDLKKIIIAGVAVVLVVVLCILLFSSCGGGSGSPEKVADKFMSAMFKDCDAEKISDLIHPDIVDAMVEDEYDGDKDEYLEEGQETFDKMNEGFEENEISIDWEVGDVEDIEDDDLEEIQEKYDDEYELEVSAAAVVEIELIAEFKGEENSSKMEIPVVEIDGGWYVDNAGVGSAMAGMAMPGM